MNAIRFPSWILLAALISCSSGCQTKTPDPLAGWKNVTFNHDNSFSEKIVQDYQNYINTLPHGQSKLVVSIERFENNDRNKAVKISVPDGRWWYYVLIYNQNNERIKTITIKGNTYGDTI